MTWLSLEEVKLIFAKTTISRENTQNQSVPGPVA